MTTNESTAFGAMVAASTQTACIVAAAALLLGPAVMWLARAHQLRPTPSGWTTTVATTAAAGVLASAVIAAVVNPDRSTEATSTAAWVGLVAVPMLVHGLPAVLVDVTEQRLPDALTAPMLATTLLVVATSSAVTGDWRAGLRSLLVAVLVTGAAVAVKGLHTAAIGWGDIKLLPSLGAVLGWSGVTTTAEAAALWAILIPLTALSTVRTTAIGERGGTPAAVSNLSATVPYGPALLGGAAAALVPGP